MQEGGEKKVPALRRFKVKNDVPVIPSDAVLARPPREQFPYAMDSDEGKKLIATTESAELRHRFGCWVNDARSGRHALLYYMGPDAEGYVSMRSVPNPRLRSFLDDVSHDWASFESSHVPPCDADGDPLFDPRFVSFARKRPTKGDAAAAAKAKEQDVDMEAAEPEPATKKERASVANGSALGEERLDAANKLMAEADKWLHVRGDVEMEEGPKATKPKAKAAAKPKAKAAAKPKAAPVNKKAVSSDFSFITDAVYVQESANFRACTAFDMVRLWNGDVPANGIIPGSGMDPIVARSANTIGIGDAAFACKHGKILGKHRAHREPKPA